MVENSRSVLMILMGSSMQSGPTPARISRAVELVRRPMDNVVTEIRMRLFRQFAEPMQRDRGLRVIHFMTAVESPDSNALEAGSFD